MLYFLKSKSFLLAAIISSCCLHGTSSTSIAILETEDSSGRSVLKMPEIIISSSKQFFSSDMEESIQEFYTLENPDRNPIKNSNLDCNLNSINTSIITFNKNQDRSKNTLYFLHAGYEPPPDQKPPEDSSGSTS